MLKHLVFFTLLIPLALWAEDLPRDSLQERLRQVSGLEKIETLLALSETMENEGYEAAKEIAEEALLLAIELGEKKGQGISLTNLGIIEDLFGRYQVAIGHFLEAKPLLEQFGSPSEQANNMYYLGMAYHHIGEDEKGLAYCQESLDLFTSVNDSTGISENVNGIGLILQARGKYSEATEYFFQAIDVAGKNKQSHIIGNIGISFFQMAEYEKALEYFHQCYAMELAQNSQVDIGYTLNYLAAVHLSMDHLDSSVHYYRAAYEHNHAINHVEETQNSLSGLVRTLIRLGDTTEVFETIAAVEALGYEDNSYRQVFIGVKAGAFQLLGNIDSSNFYHHQILDSALARENWSSAHAMASLLAKNYRDLEQWETCVSFLRIYDVMKDSIFSIKRNQAIQELGIAYETEKKEAKIQQLKTEEANARFRTQVWIVGAILIGIIGAILLILQAINNRKNREIKLERLRTEIASDLHDEMGSLLTGISMQAQMMKYSAVEGAAIYQDKIITNSQQAISTMRDVIWSIDSRYDQIGGLVDRMKEHAFELLNPLEIEWEFKVDSWDLDQPMSPDVRQNLYLIFKEAVNNIAKHAPKDRVQISLQQHKEEWTLDIRNWNEQEAVPDPPLPKKQGQGLRNIEMRAKRIGASFRLLREPAFQLVVSGKTFS